MRKIDKRGKLEAQPFSFRITKNRKVFIHWNGRQILTIKGSAAEKFLASIDGVDAQQAQLEMARVTGHFKHGTERR
ncbi:MAG: hypothetical protein IPJ46_06985 [Anaerolineales bacterium]|nr:hypothetical protein [Anaerolineales bacterium]